VFDHAEILIDYFQCLDGADRRTVFQNHFLTDAV
jgi:hypothetical protein